MLAASILVGGFTGNLINAKPANALTSVDELSDVNTRNWSYNALKNLVEKYNVIEGYPDRTFRGNRAPTRYEMAAALDAVVKAMGKEIARLGAEKADKADLATVAKLQDEFATELKTLQTRASALEARATKIEAKNEEQDNRLAVLERMKIYGDMAFGGYWDSSRTSLGSGTYSDSTGVIGRTRLNFDYNAVEDKGGAIVGPGTVHSTLVGAFGSGLPRNTTPGSIAENRLSNVSSISTDSSQYNTSFLNGQSNVEANAYIQSAYYSQVFRVPIMGNPDWKTTATLHAGLIPWTDIFFRSPYEGDDLMRFDNTAFRNNIAIFQDSVLPRIAGEIGQGLGKWANVKIKADVESVNVTNSTINFGSTSLTAASTAAGTGTTLPGNQNAVDGIGFTAEGDLGYNLGFLNELFGTQNAFNVGGNVFGGYYLVHTDGTLANEFNAYNGTAISDTHDNAQGFYAGLNQEIYHGIGGFGNFALNNTNYLSSLLSALQASRGNNGIGFTPGGLGGSTGFTGIKQAITFGGEIPSEHYLILLPLVNVRKIFSA